jgi:hypothetical protein
MKRHRKPITKHFEYWIVLEALPYNHDNPSLKVRTGHIAITAIPIPERAHGDFQIFSIERIGNSISVQFGDYLRCDTDLGITWLDRGPDSRYRLFLVDTPPVLMNKLIAERPILDSFYGDS